MDSTTDGAVGTTLVTPARTRGIVLSWTRRNAHSVTAAAVYGAGLAALMAQEFVQDSWLAIAGGRDIAQHGLPWHERLTTTAYGEQWVDQQWLGKLFLYALTTLDGVRLLAVGHVFFVLAAVCMAIAIARRRGASDQSVFWVGAAAVLLAPWGWQLRTQSLAYVLFVGVLALITSEKLRPATRVLACGPLLLVWANVHGSVTLGAALVTCAAIVGTWHELRERGPTRRAITTGAAALVPAACLFASPYGLSLVQYYQALLGNPLMGRYVHEWRAPTLQSAYVFFALAAVVLWLVARHGRVLTTTERWILLITGITGLLTIRGIVWFGLAAILLVPKLVDARRSSKAGPSHSRLLTTTAAVSSTAAIAILGLQLVHLPSALGKSFPDSAARVAAIAADSDRTSKVFASERYADWLLWKQPQLAGRIVYDVRFELFDARRFAQLAAFHAQGTKSDDITDEARLFVLDRVLDATPVRTLRREPGAKVLYEDEHLVVISRHLAFASQ
jgi:hypothetical protein